MRGFTSGLAVPNYVIDLPQGGGKVTLQPNYMLAKTEKEVLFSNYQGRVITCHNPVSEKHTEPHLQPEVPAKTPDFVFSEVRDADRVIV